MASNNVSNKVLEIIKPALDADVSISLEQAVKLLEEADYDLQETGFESFNDIFDQLEDDFELNEGENGIMVKCLNVNIPKEPIKPKPTNTQLAIGEDVSTLNRKISGVIRKLIKDFPEMDGSISLPKVGVELSNQKLKLPDGEKLSSYLRRFPSLFEVTTNGVETFVKNMGERQSAPSPTNTPSPSARKGFISMFNLFDFAYFQDYNSVKKELSNIASQDGWFILPNPMEKDPYLLLDYKFRNNFAILVNRELQEHCNGIIMHPDKVVINTGFSTDDGKCIKAHFLFNQQRDANRWQNWVFDHFSIEES